jgi:dethiobiotin synthetase/adenosylmethionine--8-amino-7-oxononanoate aminotransferase
LILLLRGATSGRPVSAEEIVQDTLAHLGLFSAHSRRPGGALALVETAGGVASPAPCGRLQCDVMRPLRLPGLMVGDR